MPPPYPILDNRRIDQWKVTELKEELKRRKLATKGLKDDLIKRLAEAIHNERENAESPNIEIESAENVDNGVDCIPCPEVGGKVEDTVASLADKAQNIVDCGITNEADSATVEAVINDSLLTLDQREVKEGDQSVCTEAAEVEVKVVSHNITEESVFNITRSVVSEDAFSEQHLHCSETQKENGDSKAHQEGESLDPSVKGDDSKPLPEDKGSESTHKIVMPNTSAPNNQVSEVSPTLGSQIKYDSIYTNSVSINEKTELKGNIIADNVKLELDVIKPEMVEPSLSNVGPVGGESHPMDVEEPYKTTVEAKDDNNAANTDMNKKNDTSDAGYPEKLNLDRSSGDDSMEEDFLENKQIDSKYNSDDAIDKNEKTEMPLANEDTPVDVVGDDLHSNKEIHDESKNCTALPLQNEENTIVMPAEKRKLNDQAAVESSEPLKRQRRWNTESVKVLESKSFNHTPKTTPKDVFHSTAFKRSLSVSDSKSSVETPMVRVVPPSQKPPTNSLRIDHFLRPFTLKAVQELLGKTGTLSSFWMDQIKTHCYVTYSSVEEAIETRNAVYNLQWPPYGGKHLVAEFFDPQEVKMLVDAPANPGPTVSSAAPISPRQEVPRQQPLPPPPLVPSANLPPARERLPPPSPDPPIATLDDLFRKTTSIPRIYYLPLSEEQVAAKVATPRGRQL